MVGLELVNKEELPNEDKYLWRYMSLHKFIDLIKNQSFKFSRMDLFEDPLEGIPFDYLNQSVRHSIRDVNLADVIVNHDKYLKILNGPKIYGRMDHILDIQTTHFVSCWFCGERESLAMWNLYSNEDGVAIKIPFKYLITLLKPDEKIKYVSSFYCGKVNYQDFRNTDPYSTNELSKVQKRALRKDVSFIHENEIRFVIKKTKPENKLMILNSKKIDLNELKMNVICHPRMLDWKKKNIKKLLEEVHLSKSYVESEIVLR